MSRPMSPGWPCSWRCSIVPRGASPVGKGNGPRACWRPCGVGQLPALQVASRLATERLDDIRGVVAQLRMHDGMDLHAALSEIIAPFPQPPQIHLDVSQDARPENVAQAQAL